MSSGNGSQLQQGMAATLEYNPKQGTTKQHIQSLAGGSFSSHKGKQARCDEEKEQATHGKCGPLCFY